MARLLGGTGLSHGTSTMQTLPFPNGPVHNLDTSAGAASTPALQAKTKAVAFTLTDAHYVSYDGTPATVESSWKLPQGFFVVPLPKTGVVSLNILPESGAAAGGDGIQSIAEWQ